MKKLFTIILFAVAGAAAILPVQQAYAQTYLWAQNQSAGGTGTDDGTSTSTDASGNVFVTGYFQSSSITFGTTTLTNADNTGNAYDVFIVKYDGSGNALWAQSAGGTSWDAGYGISTDANGNVFVTGYFQSASIIFGTTTLTSTGSQDMFIVKYDASGTVQWAKSAGGTNYDQSVGISTDASGNVFVTGSFLSSSLTLGTTTLTNTGGYDMFIVKYDAGSGTVLWAKNAVGTSTDAGAALSTDASGNVFVAGYFQSASIIFDTTTLTNADNTVNTYDMFIVKYDASGIVLWVKGTGGTSTDVGLAISTDASGNVFVTGFFASSSITFGTITLTNADNTGNTADMFIVKYDAGGNAQWAQGAGGTTFGDQGSGISTDANGNVFVTGYFGSPSITFGTTVLINAGSYDMFIVKCDVAGNAQWAQGAGGNSWDAGYGISTAPNGNVFVTGRFYSPSITFGTTTLTNAGFEDMFIVKLGGVVTGITEDSGAENSVLIFPNPADSKTEIQYSLKKDGLVELDVFDMTGKKISTFVNEKQNAGKHSVNFNADALPNGIYLFQLTTESGIDLKNLVIAK